MDSKFAHIYCPDPIQEAPFLSQSTPMALSPALGRTLIGVWLEWLQTKGVRRVNVYVSDRPEKVRKKIGAGDSWGLKVEVIPAQTDPTLPEFQRQLKDQHEAGDHEEAGFKIFLNHLPDPALETEGKSEKDSRPITYSGWFNSLVEFAPKILEIDPHGVSEVRDGIQIGIRSRIDESATLMAPCWIGEGVSIGHGARIGPNTIIESHSIIGDNAIVEDSWVWPETFVGELTEVRNSFVNGSALLNWKNGSQTIAPDEFLLCSLRKRQAIHKPGSYTGRIAAALLLALTCPVAVVAVLFSFLRKKAWVNRVIAVAPLETELGFASDHTLVYREFPGFKGLLKRWPQLWNIVLGEFHWIGNRPLSLAQAQSLENDFERLWLKSPIGFLSLSDAERRGEAINEDTLADAGFYSAQPHFRLKLRILRRSLFRI